jgi:hypothetical protein
MRAVVADLRDRGVRVSLFVDPEFDAVDWAAEMGADRVELYTEPFARAAEKGGDALAGSLERYIAAAGRASDRGLGVNAGHDLDLENLVLFRTLPHLDEVSIGHALIGDRLDVNDYCRIEARIMQRGDQFIISSELIDARTNHNLWGDRYDRKLSDLLAVQGDIASAISANLRQRLGGERNKQLAKGGGTNNPEAYQLYLKGRYYWEKRTPEALDKSKDYFNQAIAKDPNYALAYVGLAD